MVCSMQGGFASSAADIILQRDAEEACVKAAHDGVEVSGLIAAFRISLVPEPVQMLRKEDGASAPPLRRRGASPRQSPLFPVERLFLLPLRQSLPANLQTIQQGLRL